MVLLWCVEFEKNKDSFLQSCDWSSFLIFPFFPLPQEHLSSPTESKGKLTTAICKSEISLRTTQPNTSAIVYQYFVSMSRKRPQAAAYEADGNGVSNSNSAPLVAFGTTFPALDSKTRDDGSHVPVWKQGVTDERGRWRLHGAFTEGLSAGYDAGVAWFCLVLSIRG